jgi:hypothetical protein
LFAFGSSWHGLDVFRCFEGFDFRRTFDGLFRLERLNDERTACGFLSPRITREFRESFKEVFLFAGVTDCVVI